MAHADEARREWRALPLVLLPARLVLFALGQALIAPFVGGWDAAAGWWPHAATFCNLLVVALLVVLLRREGESYRHLLRIDRSSLRSDLLVLAAALVAIAPLAVLPNIWLATWLFGSPEAPLALFIRPLPPWSAWLAVLFPLTIMAAELPLYFGYIMPRLEARTRSVTVAILLPALFLAAQHVTLPLIFDLRFMTWRLLMFLPFALALGALLRWRPRLLVWLMVIHGLLDLSVVVMLIGEAR